MSEHFEVVIGPGCPIHSQQLEGLRVRIHEDETTLVRSLYEPAAALLILSAERPRSLKLIQNIRHETNLHDLPIIFASHEKITSFKRKTALRLGISDFLLFTEDPEIVQTKITALASLYQKLKAKDAIYQQNPFENSMQFLDSLIENLPDMIFVKDAKDLRFVRFNKAGEELLGFNRADLIGKNDYDFFPKDQADSFTSKDRAVLDSGHLLDVADEPIQTKSGQKFLHTKKIPLYDQQGHATYLLGISEEITARKRAEEERIQLAKEQVARAEAEKALKRLSVLADSMPIIIMISDAAGNIEYLNKHWYEYTGMSPSETSLWNWTQVIHPQHITECINRVRHSLATGEQLELQFLLKTKDGNYRWHIGRALPQRDANGKITKWYGSSTDIEDQKQTQERIESLVNDLQDAVSVRDEFLSVASHELKTPVTSLKLQIQIAQQWLEKENGSFPRSEKILKLIDSSGRQVDRLVRLIEDLLDVSRIQAGKLSLHFEKVEISSLVREVVEKMQDQLNVARSPVTVLHSDPCTVVCDRFRIEQVLINLLTNTMKYGSAKPVEISVIRNFNKVQIVVKDSGIGIDPAKHKKIFERFERAVSSRNISGLGLGLYIAKQITDGHHGNIFVESEVGKGSTFTVELPTELPSPLLHHAQTQ